jgi:hypothetical protein
MFAVPVPLLQETMKGTIEYQMLR